MESLKSAINLEMDESIRDFYKTKENAWGLNKEGYNGYHVLTSKRLIIFRERGFFNKNYELINSYYFKDIRNVSSGGRMDKFITINGIKHFLEGADNDIVANLIQTAVYLEKSGNYCE